MSMSGQLKTQANLPEKKFRAGSITATVWKNQTKDSDGNQVTYRNVTFAKRYRDDDGRWKNTSSLQTNDIPKAVLVLQKAYEYLALSESNDVEIEFHQG